MRIKPHRADTAAGAALLALALALGGCGSATQQAQSPSSPSGSALPSAVAAAKASGESVDPAIVAADNGFGLRMLGELLQGSGGSNVAIAPVSLALTLQIAYNGAAGATQQAMAQTLELGSLTTAQLNDANAALEASLIDADPAVTLTIANSLWVNLADDPVLPSFTQMDQTYYGAQIGDLAGGAAAVNAWVAQATDGLITDILPAGNYQAVLANAVYFKAQWTYAFDPQLTVAASFTTAAGGEVQVEMMQQSGSFAYLQGAGYQAVRLPYGNGRFSMLIMLPAAGSSAAALAEGLTPESLAAALSQMQPMNGAIGLPRFNATFSARLDSDLAALGMGPAFCPAAGFAGIFPGACIDYVGHATVVQVDESGTVAAGSTVVGVTATAVEPMFTMTMDRPFLYAILDDQSGELLFVGVLQDPS